MFNDLCPSKNCKFTTLAKKGQIFLIFRLVNCSELQRPCVAGFFFLLPCQKKKLWHVLFWHSVIYCLTTLEVKININAGTARRNQASNPSHSVLSPGKPYARTGRYKKPYSRQLWNKLPCFLIYAIARMISVLSSQGSIHSVKLSPALFLSPVFLEIERRNTNKNAQCKCL